MAAAEARAVWQRTANRCFVQEDAKRAPKLACCPSSSSTQQQDWINGNVVSEPDHSAANLMPLNWNPKNSNLPPDAKWWLHLQPSYGCPKEFICEPMNFLDDDELENKKNEHLVPSSENTEASFRDSPMHDDLKKAGQEYEYCAHDEELMFWKYADQIISKKPETAFSDMALPSVGDKKCTPWWRISDTDELASLVAQKSSQNIENCDLPRPTQTVYVRSETYACLERLENNKIFPSPFSQKLHGGMRIPGHQYDNEKLCSSADASESKQALEKDASRAELLEALRRSQTRAREAEMAAQRAYNEKEHIVKLVFRQASHLFAYKQWLQILQLESLHLQLKFNEHQIPMLFADFPWVPLKGRRLSSKDTRKGKKHKKWNICKNMVAFAIGLGLAGAGVLLGWTLGWLLACF